MGSIRRHGRFRVTACRFLLCLAFVCSGGRTLLPAQNAGTPLSLEIKNAEAAIALPAPETSPAQKENALIRLARLCQLSGDLEAASKHWLQAAAVEQGSQNSNSLAAGAFCLAAIGEWEQARTAIAPLLQNGAQNTAHSRAHFLDACAQVWLNQDASRLRAMADDPAYGNLRSAVYYTLWKISGEKTEIKASGTAVEWELRLLSEFPRSPESRIIAPEESLEGEARARFRPSPLWLFLPGLGNTPGEEISAAPPPASPPAPVPPPPPQAAAAAPAVRYLQTGLFSKEENARNQAQRLETAGFSAVINRRTVNGGSFWSVTVPGGADINKTTRDLKNAGFDSFPL